MTSQVGFYLVSQELRVLPLEPLHQSGSGSEQTLAPKAQMNEGRHSVQGSAELREWTWHSHSTEEVAPVFTRAQREREAMNEALLRGCRHGASSYRTQREGMGKNTQVIQPSPCRCLALSEAAWPEASWPRGPGVRVALWIQNQLRKAEIDLQSKQRRTRTWLKGII